MKAIVWTRYGPPEVLQLREVPTPQPSPDQVLIKIHAATVFAGDAEMRRFDIPWLFGLPLRLFLGITRPRGLRILGQEISGVVEAVGAEVKGFAPGDEVFAPLAGFGGYAEYVVLAPERQIVAHKPAGLGHGEAAALCVGGINALYFHRKAAIRPGEKVLLVGAGGSIGTLSLQLAKRAGAEVTVVDTGAKLAMLENLGADHVIDYKTRELDALPERYDVVCNIVNKSSFATGIRLLRPHGRLLLYNIFLAQQLRGLCISAVTGKRVISGLAPYKRQDLEYLAELAIRGELKVQIDRHYNLAEVPEAHVYVDSGAKAGNVVIDVV